MDSSMLSKGKEAYEKGQDVIGAAKAYNSLQDVQKQAKEIGKDKFATGAEYIQKLKGNLPPETQLSGVSDFTTAMVRLISRIAKKDGNLDAIRSNPGALQYELNACGVSYSELKLDEQAALQHLPRIASEGGATSVYLKEAWSGIVDQGEESAKGWTAKVKNFVKNDPVATAAIVLTAVAVGYVGWKLFKKFLSGKKAEKAKGKKDEEGGMSFGTKMLLGAGLATVAAFGGKALVKKILAMMGKEDIAELLKKGDDLPEETRKILEDQRDLLEKQGLKLDEMRAKMSEKGKAAKGAVVGAVAGAKDKVGVVAEKTNNAISNAVEITKNPKQQFNVSVGLFTAGYFYEWVFDDANAKNNTNNTIKNLRNVKVSDLFSIYKNAEAKGETTLSPSKIPIDNSKIKIGDKELFLTLQKLSELYLLFGKNEKINTVEDLFLFAYKSPAFRTSANVFASLKTKGLSSAMDDFGEDFDSKFDKMKYHVVDSLNEDFSTNLNNTDKKELRKIQAMLLIGSGLSDNSDNAVDRIISDMSKRPNQAVINEAKRFFEYIQDKSKITFKKIIDRYEIRDGDVNHLKNLLTPENLTFGRASLLISVTKGLDWEGEKSSAKDFSVIMAVIGALPKNQRNNYISQLTSAFIEEDTNIKFPALDNLKPYFKKAYDIGMESMHKYGIGILQGLSSFKFLEGFRDMTADTLAIIISTAGITADELNETGSGQAFLTLLSSKGAVIAYEKGNPVKLALSFGAKTFFVKPVGILKETLSDLKDGDFEGAVKTWMYGSIPFITIGGIFGAFKTKAGLSYGALGRLKNAGTGALKWSLYPVYAPIWALGKIGKTGKFAYNVVKAPGVAIIRANEYIRRPGRNLTAKMRTAMDKFRYASLMPGQNVSNMLINGRLFDDYYESSSYNSLSGAEIKRKIKYDKKGLVKRMASGFNAKMADKYADKFMTDYTNFFEIDRQAITSPNEVRVLYRRISNYSRNIGKHSKVYKEIAKIVKGKKPNDVLQYQITQKLIKTGLFQEEANALAEQMTDKKSINRIFDRLKRGQLDSSHVPHPTAKTEIIKTPEKQKKVLDEIKKIDKKIRQDKKDFSKKRRELAKKYKNMSDPGVRAKYESELRAIGGKLDITKQFKRRVKLTESLPKDVQKKNNVEIPDVKVVKGGKIKKLGKGLAGIAATVAAMYGASELISWAIGENEQLALEDIYKDEIASSRNNAEKQSLEENKEIMKITVNYFSDIDAEYNELFNHFSPQKLKMMSERQLKTEVSKAVRSHKVMTRDIGEFIANNLGSIEKFYKTFPDAQGEKNIGNIMALGFDKEGQKVELKYAGNDEFRTELWGKIDYVNENLDDLLAGKEPDSWDQIADSATYMIPVYGTARDAKDAYRHYGRGNYEDMAISGLWTVVGGVSDVLMVIGVGAIIKGGTTALRGAKVARTASVATKTATAVKTAKISKGTSTITMGMMGADLFRPLFRPALDIKKVF